MLPTEVFIFFRVQSFNACNSFASFGTFLCLHKHIALALAIATMGTANAFGLFLLAPITDVLSHRCLGATPGSVGAF